MNDEENKNEIAAPEETPTLPELAPEPEAPKRSKIYPPRFIPALVDEQDKRCSCGSRLCLAGPGQYECNGCGLRTR